MAIKETKRKAFNFLRSYFDVLNELKTDKDRLEFLLAIINKQFLDVNPEGLTFIANLCYESQRHQIETSVSGWKTATSNTCMGTPSTPLEGTPSTPKQEEEEEGQEEVKVKEEQTAFLSEQEFLKGFNAAKGKLTGIVGKYRILSGTDLTNFNKLNKAYGKEDFNHAIKMMSKDAWVKEKKYFTTSHFLRIDIFNKFLNQTDALPMAKGLIEGN